MLDPNNSALEENEYIQRLVHVRGSDYLTKISPLISEFVKKQWSTEKESKIKEFIEYHKYADKLLELLEEKNKESNDPVDENILESTSRYSAGVQGGDDDKDNPTGYWLWFEDYLLEEFKKQTGKSYIDEVFISSQRISNHETTA